MITIKINDIGIEKIIDSEKLIIEAYGINGIRVKSIPLGEAKILNGALEESDVNVENVQIIHEDNSIKIVNGKISAVLDHRNCISFYNDKNVLILKEYIRLRAVKHDDGSEDASKVEVTKDFNSTLKLKSREFKSHLYSEDYKITTRFESDPSEKIYGMGQYQHPFLNLKNTLLELAPRNSQISIPFYLSSKGYGFLWNNPGIGRVYFAKNLTEWVMESSDYIDYWVTVGSNPEEILYQYTNVTGRVPKMPKNLLGLWQSKLRYRTDTELLEIVRKYQEKGVQLSTIAIDYFHWPKQGEYRFDLDYWSNIPEFIKLIQDEYGVQVITSVWPTVQSDAKNYNDYLSNGYLINVNRGVRMTMQIQGNTVFIDMTNKEARKYVRKLIDKNYGSLGINYYWLDVAEPGYSVYDFDNYKYFKGSNLKVGNLYAIDYIKMISENVECPVVLIRGGWAGIQKYGALIWSGDIDSSFEAFRNQVNTGLNMGLAGIPWWTTDIGGFHGGNPNDVEFRELMIRWFQYATFSPILRMHGDRQPHSKPLSSSGGGSMITGAGNEIWSYGEEAEKIFIKYIKIRECILSYLDELMTEASENGSPIMRPLFYHYFNDEHAWNIENDIYMLGRDMVVAPITEYQKRNRVVYLPTGDIWINIWNSLEYSGGKEYRIEVDLDQIPIFIRKSKINKFDKLLKIVKEES